MMNRLKTCGISNNQIKQEHNLNIQMYSLQELLNLFNLTNKISLEDLKRAKKQVLMMHPDKSRLPPQYFLFYKKAFDVIVQFYNTQNRVDQEVKHENINYEPMDVEINKATTKNITNTIENMVKEGEFQDKFNQLFEENFIDKNKPNKNDWFSQNDPLYQYDEPVTKTNMNSTFENIKQKNQGLIVYKGVQELHSTRAGNYYEDDQDDNEYICSDPFSNLKYDDLRKVHKDQTIFSVGEKDMENIPKYSSTDEYSRTRGEIGPMEKEEAERMLNLKEERWRDSMLQKDFEANKKIMVNEEKNKSVLSYFLQLKNGLFTI